MTITKDYEYGTGLFAAADSIASISNVVLKNVSIVNNSNYVGAMVGMWLSDSSDNKKVFNCSVSGTITTSKTSSECIGGLIGVGIGKLLTTCCCGLGLVWWFVDLFLIMDATRKKNLDKLMAFI